MLQAAAHADSDTIPFVLQGDSCPHEIKDNNFVAKRANNSNRKEKGVAHISLNYALILWFVIRFQFSASAILFMVMNTAI